MIPSSLVNLPANTYSAYIIYWTTLGVFIDVGWGLYLEPQALNPEEYRPKRPMGLQKKEYTRFPFLCQFPFTPVQLHLREVSMRHWLFEMHRDYKGILRVSGKDCIGHDLKKSHVRSILLSIPLPIHLSILPSLCLSLLASFYLSILPCILSSIFISTSAILVFC